MCEKSCENCINNDMVCSELNVVCDNFEPFPDEEDFADNDGASNFFREDDICDFYDEEDDGDLMDFTGDEDFDDFCDHEDFE